MARMWKDSRRLDVSCKDDEEPLRSVQHLRPPLRALAYISGRIFAPIVGMGGQGIVYAFADGRHPEAGALVTAEAAHFIHNPKLA